MSSEPASDGTGFKYWAFLSYSHTDKKWGDWLHKALETYRVPRRLIGKDSRDGKVPQRVFPIFRDREELPVSADLGSNINEALRESRYLIVICSPRSAQSRWVGEEIKTYKALGREDRILALIVDGEPNASDGKPGFTLPDECFHEAMRYRRSEEGQLSQIRSEPIAADAREGKDGKNNAKLKLLAGLLGVNYDDLKQRDNERRIRRLRLIVVASLTVVLGFGALSVYALLQKQAAQGAQARAETEKTRAETALARTRAALSHSDFLQAIRSIDENRIPDALAQLARSLSLDSKNEAALCRLTTLLTYRSFGIPLRHLIQDGPIHTTQLPLDFSVSHAASDILGKDANIWAAEKQRPSVHPKFEGDADEVSTAEFTPDGKRMLIFSDYHIARVWDAQTGEPVAEPFKYGDRGDVNHAQFSPDGKRVINRGTARLWDSLSGKPLTDPLQKGEDVRWASFSSDSKFLATAGGDALWLWDGEAGKPINEPLRHAGDIREAQFSPDGKRIASASRQVVQVWETAGGKPLSGPLQHTSEVLLLEFNADGKALLTIARDNTVRIWNTDSGKLVTALKAKGELPHSANFSPDGRFVVISSTNGVGVYDAQTGKLLTEPFENANEVTAARFSSDGRWIVTAPGDKTARVWNSRTGLPLTEPLLHNHEVQLVSFSADGQRVVALLSDTTGSIWDVRRGSSLAARLARDAAVTSARFTADGKKVLTHSDHLRENSARIWDADSGKPLSDPLKYTGEAEFSPDGDRLLTHSENSAQIWDVLSGKLLGQLLKHDETVMTAQFSPDGTRIVTASFDKTARIWDGRSGEPIGAPFQHDDRLMWAKFSPDGKQLATSSEDKTAQMRIWDVQSGQPIAQWKYTNYIRSGQFNRDGSRLVTWTLDDETARIWDTKTGHAVGDALQHLRQITWAEFSPDCKKVVTASEDGTARVWDAETGRPLTDPLRHSGQVLYAQFSPDNEQVITGASDKTVRLWDATSGKPLSEPWNNGGEVVSAQFSPDGKRIVTASDGGTAAAVWDISPRDKTAPTWLPRLAESIATKHLNDQGVFESLTGDQSGVLQEIREQLANAPKDDEWATWGRWFLADRSTRTISPFSKITIAEHIEYCIEEKTQESLDEAEQFAVGRAEVLQRIAQAREALQKSPVSVPSRR